MRLNNKDLSYKEELKIKGRRTTIAAVLSIVSLIAASYDYAPYHFVFFTVFFSSTIVIYLNSLIESVPGAKEQKVLLLAIMASFLSYAYLMTHNNNNIAINDAMNYCYSEKGLSSQFCEELYSRLDPPAIDDYEYE